MVWLLPMLLHLLLLHRLLLHGLLLLHLLLLLWRRHAGGHLLHQRHDAVRSARLSALLLSHLCGTLPVLSLRRLLQLLHLLRLVRPRCSSRAVQLLLLLLLWNLLLRILLPAVLQLLHRLLLIACWPRACHWRGRGSRCRRRSIGSR